jgi:CxxC-x17-CxxC domain-containing protein
MGDFRRDRGTRFGGGHGGGFNRRDGGQSNFSRKKWGGSSGKNRSSVAMYQAVCDQCGKSCEVPFRPTEGKPVYCNTCFRERREAENNRMGDRFPQKNVNSYETPVKTNIESNISKGNNDELKEQLGVLNVKMDRLIKTVEAMISTKSLVVKEKVRKVVKTAPAVRIKKLVKNEKIKE